MFFLYFEKRGPKQTHFCSRLPESSCFIYLSVQFSLRFIISFLPSILLGILTLGIYLVWETLPKMAISYFCYVGQIDLQYVADDYE